MFQWEIRADLSKQGGRSLKEKPFVNIYKGKLCPFKVYRQNQLIYIQTGKGCYILEFKFKEKKYVIDATEEDNTFGHLNHPKKFSKW